MMAWYNEWWIWMAAGLVLGIAEVLIPAWIFLGFALGAFAMGVMIAVGIGTGLSLAWAMVVFAIFSLVAYIALRQVFGIRRGQVKVWDRDIND